MSDRETLVDELAAYNNAEVRDEWGEMETAARERLAQLPEKCGTCGGRGFLVTSVLMGGQAGYAGPICPTCHGRGTVYPDGLMEVVDKAIRTHSIKERTYAVLDAINGYERGDG